MTLPKKDLSIIKNVQFVLKIVILRLSTGTPAEKNSAMQKKHSPSKNPTKKNN